MNSVKFTASKYVGGVDKYIITKEIKKEIASMEYSKRSLELTKKILNKVCSKHLSTRKPGQVKSIDNYKLNFSNRFQSSV